MNRTRFWQTVSKLIITSEIIALSCTTGIRFPDIFASFFIDMPKLYKLSFWATVTVRHARYGSVVLSVHVCQ